MDELGMIFDGNYDFDHDIINTDGDDDSRPVMARDTFIRVVGELLVDKDVEIRRLKDDSDCLGMCADGLLKEGIDTHNQAVAKCAELRAEVSSLNETIKVYRDRERRDNELKAWRGICEWEWNGSKDFNTGCDEAYPLQYGEFCPGCGSRVVIKGQINGDTVVLPQPQKGAI